MTGLKGKDRRKTATKGGDLIRAAAGKLDAAVRSASGPDKDSLKALSAAGREDAARDRVDRGFMPYLKRVLRQVPFAESAVALFQYVQHSPDSKIKKGIAVGALLYFITPADAVPDTLPLVGFLDDAGLIGAAVAYYGARISAYRDRARAWLRDGSEDGTEPGTPGKSR